MKNFLVVLLTALSLNAFSAIWTVNNTAGSAADFNSITAAVAAAAEGDTLYVQPSATSYGNVSLSIQLYILGAGHFPAFANYLSAQLGTLTLQAGSSGTFLKGLFIGSVGTSASITDVVISGCRIEGGSPISLSNHNNFNWIVEGCVIISTFSYPFALASGAGTGWIIRNNFISTHTNNVVFSSLNISAITEHNVILVSGTGLNKLLLSNSAGGTLRDNIFLSMGNASSDLNSGCQSCIWSNNIVYNPTHTLVNLPGVNFNNTDPLFTGVPVNNFVWNYSNDYNLDPQSVGYNTATDQGSIGLYGGAHNFSKQGYNNSLPRVDEVLPLQGSVPQGGTLQVNIKAVAGNN